MPRIELRGRSLKIDHFELTNYVHLFLIYIDQDGNEFILRGGEESSQLLAKGAYQLFPYGEDTDWHHEDFKDKDKVHSKIIYQGEDALEKFNLARMVSRKINEVMTDYAFLKQNSNSVVYIAIKAMGIQPSLPNNKSGAPVDAPAFGFTQILSEDWFNDVMSESKMDAPDLFAPTVTNGDGNVVGGSQPLRSVSSNKAQAFWKPLPRQNDQKTNSHDKQPPQKFEHGNDDCSLL